MRRESMLRLGAVALGVAMLAGCQTVTAPSVTPVGEVIPHPGETVIVNDCWVVVDASSSMIANAKFDFEKGLAQSFTSGMPSGGYNSGLVSFGVGPDGPWDWTDLAPYDRARMNGASSELHLLYGKTPLHVALSALSDSLNGKTGRTAIIVFSDGLADEEATLFHAKKLDEVHAGTLCIYPVQIGTAAEGAELMARLAQVTGCGRNVNGSGLQAPDGMEAFIREIFFGPGAPPPPPAPCAPDLGIVYFDTDKSNIKPEYQHVVDEAAAAMTAFPAKSVVVNGHTDAVDTDAYNMGLAQRRADAVKAAIAAKGIDGARVATGVFGEGTPAADNTTAEGRAKNRRAELHWAK